MRLCLKGIKFILGSAIFMGLFAGIGAMLLNVIFNGIGELATIEFKPLILNAVYAGGFGLIFSAVVLGVAALIKSHKTWLNFLIGAVPGFIFSAAFLFIGCGGSIFTVATLVVLPMLICSFWLTRVVPRLGVCDIR